MRYLNRIASFVPGIALIRLLAACGGGTPDPTPEAVAEATKILDAAKTRISNAYVSANNSFPMTAAAPISTTVPLGAKYVGAVAYNGFPAGPASVVVTLTGTGNTNVDGGFLGIFGTGNADGTVTWICGTAAAATSLASSAQTALYPYLPERCQH